MMVGSLRIVEHCSIPWFWINMSKLSVTVENHPTNRSLFDELGVLMSLGLYFTLK